ncbi:MAG: LicD family protein [Eubacterium sp.]|nr:LicD family protein [Eubacterium sp.]
MRQVENLQEEEFKILCKFKEYCQKHKLTYNLEGGTLIGAVRHKGFIPWDDDIDTIMPRKDYDRFIELTKTEPIGDGLIVVTRDSGEDFHFPFLKICNCNTILVEEGRVEETGLFIDVFPIDGANDDPEIIKKQYRFMDAIKVLENYAWMTKEEVKSLPALKRVRAYLCKLLGKKFWRNWLDKIFMRYAYGSTKYVSQIAWSTILVYNKTEEYMKQIELEFEGKLFTAPSCYHERLTMMYGNYMQLPPEDKRQGKHTIIAYWKD